jgi:hypothetical protein
MDVSFPLDDRYDFARTILHIGDYLFIEPRKAYLKAGRQEEAKQEMATAEYLQAAAREKQAEQLSGKLLSPPLPAQEPRMHGKTDLS